MRKATPAERARIRTLTDGVEGFLSDHEALYLSRLAAEGPGTGAIVEIGAITAVNADRAGVRRPGARRWSRSIPRRAARSTSSIGTSRAPAWRTT
jgi:hypothetical protein